LPLVQKHIFLAVAILFGQSISLGLCATLLVNPEDFVAIGEVGIEPVPLPTSEETELTANVIIPDLLEGDVPLDVNPTVSIDALGNSAPNTSNGLAGSNQSSDRPVERVSNITSSGPKTILIDGKPINGAAFPTAALPKAPFADLVRNSPFGPVPAISNSGRRAVSAYARPFTPTAGKQQVSLVIGGLGIDRNLTRRIINETPPEVTLSFAAHTNGLQTWIQQARDRGHEVMIEIPLEGATFNAGEPGAARTLRTDVSDAVNIRNLDWLLSRGQGYFAVTNYNGDKILANPSKVSPILAHIGNAGLGFFYDKSAAIPELSNISANNRVTYGEAYLIIDNISDYSVISSELSNLSAAASKGNPQIGVGFALPETFLAVQNWISALDGMGLELAPASYVILK